MLSIIFLIIAGTLFVGAVIGGIKPELMKNKKGIVPKKSQIVIGSSVMIFIFLVLAIVFAPPENNSAQQSYASMNLTVGQVTSTEAFPDNPDAKVGWVFSIQNQNTFGWQDCNLKLNDTYSAHLNELPVPQNKNAYVYIYESNLYKTDGTPFDPITQKPLKIMVCCNKPTVDCYEGGWQ